MAELQAEAISLWNFEHGEPIKCWRRGSIVAPEELSANLYAFITLSLAELWQWYRVLPKEIDAKTNTPAGGSQGVQRIHS
jgi:hypothetical protein